MSAASWATLDPLTPWRQAKKACVTLKHEYLEVFLEYYRGQNFEDL